MNIDLDTFICKKGSNVSFRMREVLNTIKKGNQPSTADREAPAFGGFKILEIPWLSNANYWYAFDSKMKGDTYGLQLKESQPITMDGPNVVFKTEELQYRATKMFDLGHNDYRNIVGSTGANA